MADSPSGNVNQLSSSIFLNKIPGFLILNPFFKKFTFNKQSKLNTTLSVRYKLSQMKLTNLFISNAI